MGILDKLSKLPTKNELVGSFGEWLAKYYSKMMIDGLILHDIVIDGADGYTAQIDLIIIGTKGVYVVEVKNLEGKLYGDGKKKNWYYYLHGKKYTMYSPIIQNKKHIKYLKTFLQDFGDIPFYSVIFLICDDFKVSNVNTDINNIDTIVCSGLPSLTKALEKIAENKPIVFDDIKKQEIFNYILNNQHTGKEIRYDHKQNVKEYKKNLDEYKDQKICLYCKTPLILRKGKYGEFYGCSNYPKCRYILK